MDEVKATKNKALHLHLMGIMYYFHLFPLQVIDNHLFIAVS